MTYKDGWLYTRVSFRLARGYGEDRISSMTSRDGLTIEQVAKKIVYYLKRSKRPIEDFEHDSPTTLWIEFLYTSQVEVHKIVDDKYVKIADDEFNQLKQLVRERMK